MGLPPPPKIISDFYIVPFKAKTVLGFDSYTALSSHSTTITMSSHNPVRVTLYSQQDNRDQNNTEFRQVAQCSCALCNAKQ